MKTILITGASSGLGLELTKTFSRSGWRVIAACYHLDDLPIELTQNPNLLAVSLDVTDQNTIQKLKNGLGDTAIDVLINNAGVYDSPPEIEDVVTDVVDITKVFQVNAIGPKIVADTLVSNLNAGKERLVVTISSGMGTYGALDEYAAKHWVYSASKTAVNYAMLSFGIEHPDIKSVLINPGWMKTKIGGEDALLEPSHSAQKIFELISSHTTKLPNGKLINYEGALMPF